MYEDLKEKIRRRINYLSKVTKQGNSGEKNILGTVVPFTEFEEGYHAGQLEALSVVKQHLEGNNHHSSACLLCKKTP